PARQLRLDRISNERHMDILLRLSLVEACPEALDRRVAPVLEALLFVIAAQLGVVRTAVEAQQAPPRRPHLLVGPREQLRPEPGELPPHRDPVHVPRDRRLLAPERRILPAQRDRPRNRAV